MMNELQNRWAADAAKHLVGRTITGVRYMTKEEADRMGWRGTAVVLMLDDGELLWPSRDDEGNDAGALFTTIGALRTIPVI